MSEIAISYIGFFLNNKMGEAPASEDNERNSRKWPQRAAAIAHARLR